MEKKLLLIPLALLLAISLIVIGCPSPTTTTPTTTAPTTTAPTTTAPTTTTGPTPEDPLVLTFSHYGPMELPPPINFDPFSYIFDAWCNTIEEESGGRVVFERYWGESLVKFSDAYEALLTGVTDVQAVYPPMQAGIFPMTMALALPGYVTNAVQGSMIAQKIFEEGYTAPEWEDVHVLFWCITTGNDLGSRKQIQTMDDWKGLKVAVMGEPTNSTVAALGATPVGAVITDWYIDLERGTVDACYLEFHGQVSYKFYEVAPYMVATRGNATANVFCMRQEVYDSLPPDIQEIVDRNSGMAWALLFGERMNSNFARAVYYLQNSLEEAGNPPIYFPPDEEYAKWEQAWEPVIQNNLNDLEDQGLPAQAMWDRVHELAAKYKDYQIGGISYPYWEWWE